MIDGQGSVGSSKAYRKYDAHLSEAHVAMLDQTYLTGYILQLFEQSGVISQTVDALADISHKSLTGNDENLRQIFLVNTSNVDELVTSYRKVVSKLENILNSLPDIDNSTISTKGKLEVDNPEGRYQRWAKEAEEDAKRSANDQTPIRVHSKKSWADSDSDDNEGDSVGESLQEYPVPLTEKLDETVIHDASLVFVHKGCPDTHILMGRDPKAIDPKKAWSFPVGKWNQNENGFEAAKRELREETGFIIKTNEFGDDVLTDFSQSDPPLKPVMFKDGNIQYRTWFFGINFEYLKKVKVGPDQMDNLTWVKQDDIPSYENKGRECVKYFRQHYAMWQAKNVLLQAIKFGTVNEVDDLPAEEDNLKKMPSKKLEKSFAEAAGSTSPTEKVVSKDMDCLDVQEFVKGVWSHKHVSDYCKSWGELVPNIDMSNPEAACSENLDYLHSIEELGYNASFHLGTKVAAEMVRRFYYTTHPRSDKSMSSATLEIMGPHHMGNFYNILCSAVGKYLCNIDYTSVEMSPLPKSMVEAIDESLKRYKNFKGAINFVDLCAPSCIVGHEIKTRIMSCFCIGVDLYKALFPLAAKVSSKVIMRNEGVFKFRSDTKSLIMPFTVHSQSTVDGESKLGKSLRTKVTLKGKVSTPGKSKGFPALECLVENPYVKNTFDNGVVPPGNLFVPEDTYAPKEPCVFTMSMLGMK